MALNLSLYNGVPTTLEVAKKQYVDHVSNPKAHGIFKSQGGYLVLKKLTAGKYNGCWSTLWYSTKPKKTKDVLIIKSVKKMKY